MSLINLIKLSIISFSTIHTVTGSSPRSTGSGIAFILLTFILVGYLIKINITFSLNGLCIRIIHLTVNNHLIKAIILLILLVGNKTGAKLSLYLVARNTIRSSRLRILVISSNSNVHQNLLNGSGISTSVIRNIRFKLICITIRIRVRLAIKRNDFITFALNSWHIDRKTRSSTSRYINSKLGRPINRSKNTVRSNLSVTCYKKGLISTLETNTTEPKRKRHLHTNLNGCISNTILAYPGRNLNTHIKSRVPRKLRTLRLQSIRRRNTLPVKRINQKIGSNILYPLLHRRRIYIHIIIASHRQIAYIIHLSRRIRRDICIIGHFPLANGIQTTITIPVKHNNRSLTSRSPNSIRRKGKTNTLKSNLIKNISKLLILRSSTKIRHHRYLDNTGTFVTNLKRHRVRDFDHKVRTITLLRSCTHITTRSTGRVRPSVTCHWSGKIGPVDRAAMGHGPILGWSHGPVPL